MTAFQTQIAAGIEQAMAQTGVTILYRPKSGGPPVSIRATLDNRGYMVDGGSEMMVGADRIDALILAKDLPADPLPGDSFTFSVLGKTDTYTVMIPDGRRYCWQFEDRFQIRRRIHTKLTSIA